MSDLEEIKFEKEIVECLRIQSVFTIVYEYNFWCLANGRQGINLTYLNNLVDMAKEDPNSRLKETISQVISEHISEIQLVWGEEKWKSADSSKLTYYKNLRDQLINLYQKFGRPSNEASHLRLVESH